MQMHELRQSSTTNPTWNPDVPHFPQSFPWLQKLCYHECPEKISVVFPVKLILTHRQNVFNAQYLPQKSLDSAQCAVQCCAQHGFGYSIPSRKCPGFKCRRDLMASQFAPIIRKAIAKSTATVSELAWLQVHPPLFVTLFFPGLTKLQL